MSILLTILISLPEKWGFINKSGMLVIESKFGFAGDFKEGLAAISYGGKSGYINQKGEIVIGLSLSVQVIFQKALSR